MDPDILFWLGAAYQLGSQFDKAIESYKKYQATLTGKMLIEKTPLATKRIEECQNGKQLMEKEERVFIDNLGSTVNSQYDEYGPVITADESMLLFTSKRPYTICLKLTIVSTLRIFICQPKRIKYGKLWNDWENR